MPPTSANSTAAAGFFTGAAPSLLEALSEGMHTMAQPLTVLRATLEIASGNAYSISHYQHAIDSSLAEISRVSEAMGFVQELVRIARNVSKPTQVDLAEVIATVREDLRCVLEASGIALEIDVLNDLPLVMGSTQQLRQCLFYLLQHAASLCRAGGTIDLTSSRTETELHLILRKWSSEPEGSGASARVNSLWGNLVPCLTLAEALAKGHGGHLEWQTEPFAACLSLPVAQGIDSAWDRNDG